jgi:glucose-1-phosphate cytidylyltransferase
MKAVILAGGLGTRISEETSLKPKPMVEIGGKPILWHIMKIYSHYGINEFIICLGYKGYVIKEYFANYYRHMSDITFDLSNNSHVIHSNSAEKWKVTLVETGENTMTGSRLKKIHQYLKEEQDFCLTYGDGVSDVNISKLIKFHQEKKKIATLTAVKPAGRFGVLQISPDDVVENFQEKPSGDGNYVNGGFFVLNKKIFDYIADGDGIVFEKDPLQNLVKDNQISSFKHDYFWYAMDTQRDMFRLEEMWQMNKAAWKVW